MPWSEQWIGYSAFPIIGLRDEGILLQCPTTLVLRDGHFGVNGKWLGRAPKHLGTTLWGPRGYSTWCADVETAIREATNSLSRGPAHITSRRMMNTDFLYASHDGTRNCTGGMWLVFELRLSAQTVCGLVQDQRMTTAREREGITSWRIHADIPLASLYGSHSEPEDPAPCGHLLKHVYELDRDSTEAWTTDLDPEKMWCWEDGVLKQLWWKSVVLSQPATR